MEDGPYCVWIIKRPLGGVTWVKWHNFQILGPLITCTNWAIHFKFGRQMEDGPLLLVDHKTTLKWAWSGSRDPISKFWTPNNFWTNGGIRFKFGTDIKDSPSLRMDHNTTPKYAWPGSRDLISKLWDSLNNVWTNWAIRVKFGRQMVDGPLLRVDHKTTLKWPIRFKFGTDIMDGPSMGTESKTTPNCAWPLSRDLISKLWIPLITYERIELSA